MVARRSNACSSAYRVLFALAAAYNLAFGLWAGCFPLAFFNGFDLPPPLYPSSWSYLGMVVGLYGLLYAYVARYPERGDLIIAIGLAGKVLGPLGWLVAVAGGELPSRTFPLILANDLIWWFPFAFYLLRNTPWRRSAVAGIMLAVHVAACVGLLVISPATEASDSISQRAAWVAEFPAAWIATWFLWTLSSMSLLAFCIVWSARLLELGGKLKFVRRTVVSGCLLIAAGLVCDLSGEALQIVWATEAAAAPEDFAAAVRCYNVLGPGVANGLYCIGGLMLSVCSWRTGWLRGAVGVLGIAVWIVGLGLSAAAFADHRIGMLAFGAAVMLLFLPWAAITAWRLRPGNGDR